MYFGSHTVKAKRNRPVRGEKRGETWYRTRSYETVDLTPRQSRDGAHHASPNPSKRSKGSERTNCRSNFRVLGQVLEGASNGLRAHVLTVGRCGGTLLLEAIGVLCLVILSAEFLLVSSNHRLPRVCSNSYCSFMGNRFGYEIFSKICTFEGSYSTGTTIIHTLHDTPQYSRSRAFRRCMVNSGVRRTSQFSRKVHLFSTWMWEVLVLIHRVSETRYAQRRMGFGTCCGWVIVRSVIPNGPTRSHKSAISKGNKT